MYSLLSILFPYTTLFRSSPPPGRITAWHGSWSTGRSTAPSPATSTRSEEHTSELQSRGHLVCRLLLEKKKETTVNNLLFGTRSSNLLINMLCAVISGVVL